MLTGLVNTGLCLELTNAPEVGSANAPAPDAILDNGPGLDVMKVFDVSGSTLMPGRVHGQVREVVEGGSA